MSCGTSHRHGSDPTLLWLWCRLVATAPIQPLVWELPYITSVALKSQKRKKFTRWSNRSLELVEKKKNH